MADIIFDSNRRVIFPTKYHGDVSLSQKKWSIICLQLERRYYKYNGDKIPTTLINPDYVRHHKSNPNQFLYYKAFDCYKITETAEIPQERLKKALNLNCRGHKNGRHKRA